MTWRAWWPPVAWAAGILIATWIPGAFVPRLPGPEGTDKAIHFIFFVVLGFLIQRALGHGLQCSFIWRLALAA